MSTYLTMEATIPLSSRQRHGSHLAVGAKGRPFPLFLVFFHLSFIVLCLQLTNRAIHLTVVPWLASPASDSTSSSGGRFYPQIPLFTFFSHPVQKHVRLYIQAYTHSYEYTYTIGDSLNPRINSGNREPPCQVEDLNSDEQVPPQGIQPTNL